MCCLKTSQNDRSYPKNDRSLTYKKDDSVKDALKNQNPLLWIPFSFFSYSRDVFNNNLDLAEDR